MSDVVVVGGANIDIKAKSIEANRLGTSNPGVVVTSPGGVGRNIAHNLARLGAKVDLISVVGQGAHGAAILDMTRDAGVDMSGVVTAPISTGTYVALLDHDGELITALNDMRAVEMITPEMVRSNEARLHGAHYVVADCNLRTDTLVTIAEMVGPKLIIEPVSVPKSEKLLKALARQQVLLASPNFDQMEHLSGTRDIYEAISFLHRKGLRNAVLHAGPEGAFVSDGKEVEHVAAQPPERIVDVTGAGDAAVAGLVFGLLQGDSLVDAAARGQVCAGRVIASNASTL
ncbi:MAG: carbohydrate kinase family protein [Proteobacteria bacterium]|nr:carbohydrate kinase family protein [Pseudomonadota bacterium]